MSKKNIKVKIEYKSKGSNCIVRRTTGDNIYKIEYCNKFQGWKENPDLISCWMGSFDDGYGSPPDGDDISNEDAENIIQSWENNW